MAQPRAKKWPPGGATKPRFLSGALSVARMSPEERGETLGRLFFGDALLFLLLFFLLRVLAVLLVGRGGGGRGSAERLGLREDLGEVHPVEGRDERLDPRRIGRRARGGQEAREALFIDRLSGGVEQQRTIHVLHFSHSVDFGGTLSCLSIYRPRPPRASPSRRSARWSPW